MAMTGDPRQADVIGAAAAPDLDDAENEANSSVGRLTRFGAWSLVAHASKAGVAFLVAILVARALGAASLGRYSYQLWIIGLVPILMTLGVPIALTRVVPEKLGGDQPGEAFGVFRFVRRLHLALLPIPAAVAGLLVWLGDPDPVLVVAVLVGIAVGVFILDYQALLTALRRFRLLAIAAIAAAGVQLVTAMAGVSLGLGWEGFVLLFVAAAAIGLAVLVGLSRKLLRKFPAPTLEPSERTKFVRFAGVTSVAVAANAVAFGRPELFFLDRYSSDAELGVYAAALRLSMLAVTVPLMAGRALMPEFSWLRGSGREDVLQRTYPKVCTLLAAITAPLAFGGAFVAGGLMTVVYGHAFDAGTIAAVVLLGGAMVNALAVAATAAVLTGPRPRLAAEAGVALVAVTLLLDVLLIPPFGAVGAAVANVTAQIVGVMIGLVYAWRWLDLRYPVRPVAGIVAMASFAGLAAAAVLHVAGGVAGLTAAVIVGATIYLALISATRTVTLDEVRALLRREVPVP